MCPYAFTSFRETLFLVIVVSVAYLTGQFVFNSLMSKLDSTLGSNDYFETRMSDKEDDNRPIVIDNEHASRFEQLDGDIYHDFVTDRIVARIKNTTKYAIDNRLPIILWWTPFTGEKGRIKRCNIGECLFTDLKSFQNHPQTEVMLFYGTDFNTSNLPLPRREQDQWALLHEESPKNNALFLQEDIITLFNHTCTFRQSSDYPIPTQYLASIDELLYPLNYTVQQKEGFRLAPVVYVQSGCNPPSDRDAYINELMKYVKVDSYGKCLNNKEMPQEELRSPLTMHDDSFKDFISQYKFQLAFENAICNDYITEKLWRPIKAGAVPIYKGAPNVLEWMPNNHSIIMVDDFKSPKELADYINYLDTHPEEYEKYLEFKKKGVTNTKLLNHMKNRPWGVNDLYKMSFITGFECFVCDRLHSKKNLVDQGENRVKYVASAEHYGCPKPRTYPYKTPDGYEDWERDTWTWEYDDAKLKAKDIKKKVLSGKR